MSLNPYLFICFCIYCIYLIFLSMNMINTIKKFLRIREIYSKYLKINDYRIKFITWDDIVNVFTNRLNAYNEMLDASNINIYTVNNKICYQSNIIISLIRNRYISLPNYSNFLEWNFIFCIIEPIILIIDNSNKSSLLARNINYSSMHMDMNSVESDSINDIQYYNNKRIYKLYNKPLLTKEIEDLECNIISLEANTNPFISENELSSPITDFDTILYNTLTENIRENNEEPSMIMNCIQEYIDKVHYRIQLVFWINLICIPFTVIILGLYLIIKYGEQIYRNPGFIFQRQINITVKWKLRYYNEIPNLYDERLIRIQCNMDKIINKYNSMSKMILFRFLTFLVGSIFIIILILSLIASEQFSQLEIVPNHNIIWLLGVSGTLLLILNKLIMKILN